MKSGNTKNLRLSWKLCFFKLFSRENWEEFSEFFHFLSRFFVWIIFFISARCYFRRTEKYFTMHIWRIWILQLSTSTRCDKNWKLKVNNFFGIFEIQFFGKIFVNGEKRKLKLIFFGAKIKVWWNEFLSNNIKNKSWCVNFFILSHMKG